MIDNQTQTREMPTLVVSQELNNWKNREKEIRDDQVGFIELQSGENGEKLGLVNIRDRLGGRLWLPCDVSEDKLPDLEDKFKKLGYEPKPESWVGMELDWRTAEQLYNASAFLPPLLATHAVMNSEPGTYYFPPGVEVKKMPAQLIGLEGKPHSGKTLGMMVFLLNGDDVNGYDFDPFSGQSLDHTLNKVKEELVKSDNYPLQDLNRALPIIKEAYESEKSEKVLEAKAKTSLSDLLDKAIETHLDVVTPNEMTASLVDLPGEDPRTEKYDAMHFVRHTIPTIDMTRVEEEERDIVNVPILEWNNFWRTLVINDKIRANLGGLQRWDKTEENQKVKMRAAMAQWNFANALWQRLNNGSLV